MAELLHHSLVECIWQTLGPLAKGQWISKRFVCTVEKFSNKTNIVLNSSKTDDSVRLTSALSCPLPPKQPYMLVLRVVCIYIFQKQKGNCCPSYLKLSGKVPGLSQPLIIITLKEIQLYFSRSHHSQEFKLSTSKYWVAKEQNTNNPLHEGLQWPTQHKNCE